VSGGLLYCEIPTWLPSAAPQPSSSRQPVRIGAVATSGYDFREG
jgi:hypothetical protein